MRNILLLGGTEEASSLAKRLSQQDNCHVVTSLAGRTVNPRALSGEVRVGGFGGVFGLVSYMKQASIDVIIDATHPFAAQMACNAEIAANLMGVPRLKLLRPEWKQVAGDRWIVLSTLKEAATVVKNLAKEQRLSCVFLTTGYQGLEHFKCIERPHFLVRLVDQKSRLAAVPNFTVVNARGPFSVTQELSLYKKYKVQALVSKNSGAKAVYAKIIAARLLQLPVIMVDRPKMPEGNLCKTVDAAIAWLGETS